MIDDLDNGDGRWIIASSLLCASQCPNPTPHPTPPSRSLPPDAAVCARCVDRPPPSSCLFVLLASRWRRGAWYHDIELPRRHPLRWRPRWRIAKHLPKRVRQSIERQVAGLGPVLRHWHHWRTVVFFGARWQWVGVYAPRPTSRAWDRRRSVGFGIRQLSVWLGMTEVVVVEGIPDDFDKS